MFAFRMTARNLARGATRRTITKLRSVPSSTTKKFAGYVSAVAGVALIASSIADNAAAVNFNAVREDIGE